MLSCIICAVASAQARPFTYQEMLLLDRISGLSVDATGHYALFNVRATDMEKNKGVSALWLKDLSEPTTPERKLGVSEGGARDAQWSPDGQTIYFLSSRGEGGTAQVWKTDVSGAKAEQVTRLPLDVGAYRIAPDTKSLVVSLAVFPECTGDEIACTVKKQAERAVDKSSGEVYTKVFVRHWDTWADGTRNHLFRIAIDGSGAQPVALTPGYDGDVPSKPFGGNEDFFITPDSRSVYFSGREAGTTEPWSTNFDIYSVPMGGGPFTNLTAENKAWDASPRVSPDGKTLAYKAMKRPGFEADRFEIKLRDVAGKVATLAADWDRSVDDFAWSRDGKSLFVVAGDVGRTRLFKIDVSTGTVTALSKDGHIDAFHETPGGFVFLKSALNSPSQLYLSKPGGVIDMDPINLTAVNAKLKDLAFGAYEQFQFKGWNEETVHGFVVKPAGYVEGKKYPVAFLIHGGPQGSFGDGWSYRWNPQSYAGAGYAVVMIDFHGSTGYGQAFCDAISQHWGDRPLEDLQKGWAYALKTYPFLDGDRAAALGASYGGFMVNWIAGNWKAPWKCLVSHDGVFDARSMGFTTEEMWFEEWEQGGSVFTDPAKYDAFNPMLQAKDWSVPMLVIHSDLDYRIGVEQGIGAFTALQAKGVPSAFLRFPDENHWVLKPQNSMKWHKTVFGWLDTYIGAH
ncbi:MAG: S9 family peptidase [Flavobacteriales bacterium]|nr:S9 family peptidase [Flavobacteriales bacterium]MBK7751054.1 S9 family peptidase [Flavobacteriales bacterium]MBK9073393.1 S9 family peptidase [Flavobacteriales bacterium]MBK9539079.1 S9 family peptidase [Flavobacteriales bacterium]